VLLEKLPMNLTKLANIGIWVLAGLVAALFLLSGVPKLFDPGWVSRFAGWGYSAWFLYLIAVLEIAGAVGLLIPRLAPFAAAGLIIIMFGAMYTHITHDQGILWNVAYVVVLSAVGLYRWKHRKIRLME
jgi:uncharacterized membrane protein YphA (DoxX/SURF4 family)